MPKKEAYRYIALDLDGTVLDSTYHVSPKVVAALAAARETGRKIVVSTGRVYASALPHARKFGGADGYVCSNGADVFDGSGTRITAHHLDEKVSRSLIALSRRFDSHFHGFIGDAWHYERETPFTFRYEARSGYAGIASDFDSMPVLGFTKCIFMDDPERLRPIETEIAKTFGPSVRAVYSAPFMLEVMAPGISKSQGLAECLVGLGGSLAETIAFGDAENDEDMLLAAGIGVAMGNAPDDMKARVGRTAPSVGEDGVAVWLADFFGFPLP
ncbi:MAG: Cof-type HAD-IIB family hydrolase [Rectinemataceae bacterium]